MSESNSISKPDENKIVGSKQKPKAKREDFEDNGYDPYAHRNMDYSLSNMEAAMGIVKGAIGPGVISLPYAFNLSGYIPAILTLIVYPAIFLHCTHILFQGIYTLCKEHRVPILSYADAMRLALKIGPPALQHLSKPSVFLVDALMVLYHFSAAIIYIIFIASMVQNVIDDYIISLDSRILMVTLILPLIPVFSIKTLKNMVPLWGLANFLQLISLIMIFVYIFGNLPTVKHIVMFESAVGYAESFGIFLFSLQSMGTLLPIEAKMKNPKNFLGWRGLIVVIHVVVISVYIIFGFFGYWRYGIDIEENMTMNLSERAISAQLVRISFATAVYLTYPLQASVVINNIWHHWLAPLVIEKDRQPIEFVVRIIVVLLSTILAVCLVNISAILPLTGSICITSLGIVFPALLNICIRYQNGFGKLKWMLIKDIALMVVGVFAGLVGAWAAIRSVLVELRFS